MVNNAETPISKNDHSAHRSDDGRACAAVGMSRAGWYKPPRSCLDKDGAVIAALMAVTGEHRRWGFWKSYDRLRLDGHRWNHKRVYRVYCQLGLNHKRRTKRRLPVRDRQLLDTPSMVNAVWAVDFMSDALYVGRRFRTLNVLDEGMREGLTIEIDTPRSPANEWCGCWNGCVPGEESQRRLGATTARS